MRPRSIQIFEYCYLGAVVLGLIGTALNWSEMMAMPQMAALTARMPWYLPTTIAIGIAINLLLWYFVARRASVVAKWILVVFFAFAAIGMALVLVRGEYAGSILIFQVAGFLLHAAAVWQLFRPDALAWFAARGRQATPDDLRDTFS